MLKIRGKKLKQIDDLMAMSDEDVKELRLMFAYILLGYAKHEILGLMELYDREKQGYQIGVSFDEKENESLTGCSLSADEYSKQLSSEHQPVYETVRNLLLVKDARDYNLILAKWKDVVSMILKAGKL